jgi:YidC/Oxa1 family membrane protein insertase
MDRNLITAIVASMALIVAYNFYYEYRYGEYIQAQELAQAQIDAEADAAASKPAVKLAPENNSSPPADLTAHPTAVTQSSPHPVVDDGVNDEASIRPIENTPSADMANSEKILVIDTGVTRVTLSNEGAVPTSYLLTQYVDGHEKNVDLVFNYKQWVLKKAEESGSVVSREDEKSNKLLGLAFPRKQFTDAINNAYFSISTESENEITVSDSPLTVTYRLAMKSGVEIVKSYTFYPNKYEFDFAVSVSSDPKYGSYDYQIVWYGLEDEYSDYMAMVSHLGPVFMVNGKRVDDIPDADEGALVYNGSVPWAAMTNRYYAVIGFPAKVGGQQVSSRAIGSDKHTLEWKHTAPSTSPERYTFFLGPKRHDLLENYTNGAHSVIYYGWFDVLAKPVFASLSFFHDYLGNWGWSIIVLTFMVKLLLFPLSQASFKSMQKMQKLQPQIKKIQENYKGDRQKINEAMVHLMREHKANPLGGCLPMILQIPIFFSLYKVMLESIEIKGQGWALWITDLGLADPYYISPALLVISMFVQQLLTPNVGDPTQRKIMLAMPFAFAYIFKDFPTGLVLYWLVNNLLTIAQQWIIRQKYA